MCSLSNSALNFERSSALSTSLADVPKILIPRSASPGVRLFAVCPPTHVMTPFGFSKSVMSSNLSCVSSSKYNLVQIS